ncbi:MAG: transporter ATP-binding protein, partial [Rhodococcus erythropolis]|nr:transporter ATP-binding protein [Rhodococcus erythropolis]
SGVAPALVVVDSTTDVIGGLAGSQGIVLYELASVQGSLEDAFMKLTGDDVQYHASGIEAVPETQNAYTQKAMGGAL